MLSSVFHVLVVATAALLCWRYRLRPLAPGPPRSFWGDNTHDIPRTYPWKKFTAWNKRYGPVVSFYLGRKPVILLGTAQAAWDLLDRRSDIYSGRPRSIMAGEILSGGNRAITTSYGPRYKRWRALMQASLSSTASAEYRPLQSLESKLLLRRLLEVNDPMGYRAEIALFQMSVIFRLAYGRRVKTMQDEAVVAKIKAGGYFGQVQVPGKYLVESWPVLLWLPRSLQWFRWDVEKHRQQDLQLYLSLMNQVREQIAAGIAQPSMARLALHRQAEFGLTDEETAYTLAGPWDAGVGTTLSTIDTCILAMLHYPDVCSKAQAEIDRVVGFSRMPEYTDMDALPYVMAALKEAARWRPVAPTGFPHAVTQDDVYNGFFIPKGATVYANIHAMTQDPSTFPDPDQFRPERWLDMRAHDPRLANFTIPFGFGRRICPGMHIANQSIFIVVSRLLWAFDITPVVGPDGRDPILPSAEDYTTGLITRPNPFPYSLRVRNGVAEELICLEGERAEAEAARWDMAA